MDRESESDVWFREVVDWGNAVESGLWDDGGVQMSYDEAAGHGAVKGLFITLCIVLLGLAQSDPKGIRL